MFKLTTNSEKLLPELSEIARLFLPELEKGDFLISHNVSEGEKLVNNITVNSDEYIYTGSLIPTADKFEYKRVFTRAAKLSLYKALQSLFKRNLPWGALTGVRPTKLAYEMLLNGADYENIPALMQGNFLISKEKSFLLKDIIINQKQLAKRNTDKVNLYVHIPLCPSRCYYCSFVSVTAKAQERYIDAYVKALTEEIAESKKVLSEYGKSIYSVYIGGGTPTVLDDENFDAVLKAVGDAGVEFTCEAGRPDTITREKLEIMKKRGVTRVSVNPQTLNDETLKIIGRSHTSQQFFESYSLALKYGFIINTDIIAGLKNETKKDFVNTLDKLTELRPHNITVHTLSQKNGSVLKTEAPGSGGQTAAADMMDYAHEKLYKCRYKPYYLYRQKLMSDNLENAGYTLDGYECVNNITTMEESVSVIACGAGGISKIISGDNRIERYANIKDIKLYLEEFDLRLKKKNIFCANQFTKKT